MEDYFKSYLFAHDLLLFTVEYTIQGQNVLDPNVFRSVCKSPFLEVVGHACIIIMDQLTSFGEQYEVHVKSILSAHQAGQLALQNGALFLKNGYKPKEFVFYCGILCFVSQLYRKLELFDYVPYVRDSIASMLTGYMSTRVFQDHGGWDAIYKESEGFIERQQQCSKSSSGSANLEGESV